MSKLPIVDFSRLLKDPTEEDWAAVAEEVNRACHGNGFMYVVNHGIPADVVDGGLKESLNFFRLPESVKAQVRIDPKDDFKGHNPKGNETLSNGASKSFVEIKESFSMVGDLEAQKFPLGHLPTFKTAMTEFWKSCYPVTYNLLKLFGRILNPGDESCLQRTHLHFTDNKTPNMTLLRSHHYPPIPAEEDVPVNAARCVPHSDYGTFTILFQDSMGGLEVRDISTGEWVAADPIPGSLVVLIGDLLHQVSQGYFHATEHRVLIPEQEIQVRSSRQSIGFFVFPDDDATVIPRDTSVVHVGRDGPMSSREYYMRRIQAIQRG